MSTEVKNAFNKVKKPWGASGELGMALHAKYIGMRFNNPKVQEYVIKKNNRYNFQNALRDIKYNLDNSKSSRKFLYFTKPTKMPVQLIFMNEAPRIVKYNKWPIQSLQDLVGANHILKRRRKLEENLRTVLNVSVN